MCSNTHLHTHHTHTHTHTHTGATFSVGSGSTQVSKTTLAILKFHSSRWRDSHVFSHTVHLDNGLCGLIGLWALQAFATSCTCMWTRGFYTHYSSYMYTWTGLQVTITRSNRFKFAQKHERLMNTEVCGQYLYIDQYKECTYIDCWKSTMCR